MNYQTIVWLALLASCGSGTSAKDAGSSDASLADARVYVFAAGVAPRDCTHPPDIRVEIDGEVALRKSLEFPTPQAAVGMSIVVETWFEDVLLDQVVVRSEDCGIACPYSPLALNGTDFAIVGGGRLLRTGMQCDSCVVDGSCVFEECSPTRQEGCDVVNVPDLLLTRRPCLAT